MKCVICKNGETTKGKATVTLERDDMTFIVKSVPAEVCENCGEEYVDEEVTERLLSLVEEASRRGVRLQVCDYAA